MTLETASLLGKKAHYVSQYKKDLLFPIPRKIKREEINIKGKLPFKGYDLWNAYELSWLNIKGKPVVALGEFIFPCESLNLIESKSFKLYLNSFNNTKFETLEDVIETLISDLSEAVQADVQVNIIPIEKISQQTIHALPGICLDHLDVKCDTYLVNPAYLTVEETQVSEHVYSDLLKSNCLVTGQPDWASLTIQYSGKKINHEGLLKYIVSFRDHNEFHEQCVERIFMDIMQYCAPQTLTVYARYTRRGGLDINPYRSTEKFVYENKRLGRQ